MTTQSTIDRLIEMHMTPMANAFMAQQSDPKMRDLPFEDRFGMLVDIEYDSRKNNRRERLIKNAGFDQPEASIVDIDYTSGRKLSRDQILKLATCDYITNSMNVFITGATGSGKSYLACALGMEACKNYFKTKYVREPDFHLDIEMARQNGTYQKVMGVYANPTLLIMDEWLLIKANEQHQQDILELLQRRRRHASTIFCSQYVVGDWYNRLGGSDSPLADAIIDRIIYDGYTINIVPVDPNNDKSMREVYGLAGKS